MTTSRQITINPHVYKELEYMIELYQDSGSPNPFESVEDLVGFVLASVADGSRRPGAWERQLLEMMGLVADCDEHYLYRTNYGRPSETE
ncbi:hypothetical protein [Shewanella sp.]|uniref:hypothetical protein n=1 Tax=Shewanella sp. TaxID=50422 RepID=UPI003D0EF035